MDVDFLRRVQGAGWNIRAVDDGKAFVSCPRSGCAIMLALRSSAAIPVACNSGPDFTEVVVRDYEDLRVFLRDRRNALVLNIPEVEEMAGMTKDMLAKCEKDNPSKIPNIQTLIEWANSLGYDLVLRHSTLPPKSIRYIVDSRDKVKARTTRLPQWAGRRASSGQSD